MTDLTHITMTFRLTMAGFQAAWKCLWAIGSWNEVTFHDTRSLTCHRWLTPLGSYHVNFYAPILMNAVFKRRILTDEANGEPVCRPVTVFLTKGVHPILGITAHLDVRHVFEAIIGRLLNDNVIQKDEYLTQKRELDEALATETGGDSNPAPSPADPAAEFRSLFDRLGILIHANQNRYDSSVHQNILWQFNTLQAAVLQPFQSDSERSEIS